MSKVKSYLSLIKFSHTIFAMPFALIGFALAMQGNAEWGCFGPVGVYSAIDLGWRYHYYNPAPGAPYWSAIGVKLLLVIACMVFARSAAMAFNRYLDRRFDAKNPRTAIREIPAGVISSKNALLFTITCCVLFIVSTFFINRICFYLSPVALAVILGYSYTKRFTPLCHLILGVGLSLAPIGAYLAVLGTFSLVPILFSLTVLFWVSGFDIIYALQDEEFDRSQKLYSIPVWLGKKNALRFSGILHVCSALCVIAAGWYGRFGLLFWVGACAFIGMLIYQHSIVKPNDLRRVNIAFMTANGIASVVFAVFVITDIFVLRS